jgi:hypothetical protein
MGCGCFCGYTLREVLMCGLFKFLSGLRLWVNVSERV